VETGADALITITAPLFTFSSKKNGNFFERRPYGYHFESLYLNVGDKIFATCIWTLPFVLIGASFSLKI
jgi:hypothetical protein